MTFEPLASPAIGTGANDLIRGCPHPGPRAAKPPPPPTEPAFAVALSGGGFRASLTALGALRFLADAGLLGRVRYASSVSGGSVANGVFARAYPGLEQRGFDGPSFDDLVVKPFVERISAHSLKWRMVRGAWRTLGATTRTELLARAFDDWWLEEIRLDELSPSCRWVINAANATTGVRFGFERDVMGDWVMGRVATAPTGIRLAEAVAASAAVPGALAAFTPRDVRFPCDGGRKVRLLDGGAYDNLGLESLDGLLDCCLVVVNAGGVLRIGQAGRLPLVRDLKRANSLLYRQVTSLRMRNIVDRFEAWERARDAGEEPPEWGRRGVAFGLATEMPRVPEEWAQGRPQHPERREELALTKTSFDRFPRELCDRLLYRGWWLTGASLTAFHRDLLPSELPRRSAP